MDLAEKIKDLRHRAGHERGLGRPLTQREVAQALGEVTGRGISQAYLSQIERGRRVHLSHTTRERLARFFGVHPGYLVSDPDLPADDHRIHLTQARLAVHPRRHHIWSLVEQALALPDEDFHRLCAWIEERSAPLRAAEAD
jgi:transcriptional regulator with XRE-family HTH domain